MFGIESAAKFAGVLLVGKRQQLALDYVKLHLPMTLDFEDRTGDKHGQMKMRFQCKLLCRPQRAVWFNHYRQPQ